MKRLLKRIVCLFFGHQWHAQWVDFPWIENIGPCRRCGYRGEVYLTDNEIREREARE